MNEKSGWTTFNQKLGMRNCFYVKELTVHMMSIQKSEPQGAALSKTAIIISPLMTIRYPLIKHFSIRKTIELVAFPYLVLIQRVELFLARLILRIAWFRHP